jgi:hypothetical protein
LLLGRLVDIGAELFAITATCARAQSLLACRTTQERDELLRLVDYFCTAAGLRIGEHFRALRHNTDRAGYHLAQDVLKGDFDWLAEGTTAHTSPEFAEDRGAMSYADLLAAEHTH